MERNFRTVRACAAEAVRDFSWREYAPFGWILAAELLFILLAWNLSSVIGMGTVGMLVRLFQGDAALHYPVFFLLLPTISSWLEAFLYTIPGAVLIPLALIRMMAPMEHALSSPEAVRKRLRQAAPLTLLATVLSALLLFGWQFVVNGLLTMLVRVVLSGFPAIATTWGLSVLGAYALSAFFIYVPILAIRPGASFRGSWNEGIHEGTRLLGWTLLFVVIFALPSLPFLFAQQLLAGFISNHLRPEMVAVLIALYAITISVASYITYATAARLHWALHVEDM